jgi:DNA repair exonuclease SbcCD ATPase subunit
MSLANTLYKTILEESLTTSTFGDFPQGKEICVLLEVGIIPEAVQQFQSWTAKFHEKIRALDQQVKHHSAYWNEYHEQFLAQQKELTKILESTEQNATELNELKASMFGLIQKLKVLLQFPQSPSPI